MAGQPGSTHLGSGLSVSDGRGYRSPQKPCAHPMPNGRWRAEIAGVEDGSVVRSWTGPEFISKADALAAAVAKAAEPRR